MANFNHHPILTPIGPQTAPENAPLTLTLGAQDLDGARDPLTFSAESLPPWASLDPSTGVIRGTPPRSEVSYDHPKKVYPQIHVQVCDPEPLCDAQDIAITVVDADQPPVFDPLEPVLIGESSPLTIALKASDPDGDPLTCSLGNVPSWARFDASTCVLSGTPGPRVATLKKLQVLYALRAEFCDSDKQCTAQRLSLTVFNVENSAPVMETMAPQVVDEGKTLTLRVRAKDVDRDTLTFEAKPLPEGAAFTDNKDGTGLFSWTPRFDQSGQYTIAIMVSDSVLKDVKPVMLTVREQSLAISGRVLDPQKRPFVGAQVEVGQLQSVAKRAITDKHGFYLIKDLESGSYRVQPSYKPPEVFSLEARTAKGVSFGPAVQTITLAGQDHPRVDFVAHR